ncbi:MAG: right-handed parallel beta-helix repeat-containing protein [Lachnospiraceae bacterium]|nr:right-handed parallel beta-helix repeat-containing protein [Lachnospiraceae bacterium]
MKTEKKRRRGYWILAGALLVCVLLLGAGSTQVMAATYTKKTVSASSIESKGATKAIQALLDEAKEKATASNPYKITVPEGTYKLTKALHIYSNTFLVLKGVTLKQTGDAGLIIVGSESDNATGYYYKNITIYGGTLDLNKKEHTLLKVAHAYNFTLKKCTLKNVKNGHLMEVAGVKGLTVRSCTFQNQTLSDDASRSELYYEAIQIDVLVKKHFSDYVYEDLPCKNIVIDNCKFKNVPRGVGSHTAVLNNPVKNIQITNSTFTNCRSAAIQGQNWINCTISDNTINGTTPRGIAIYPVLFNTSAEGVYLSSTLAAQGGVSSGTSVKYKTPAADQKIVITNNTITLSGSDPWADYDSVGILVNGFTLSKKTGLGTASGDKIPKGDYYVSGVTISGNTIKTKYLGIRLVNTKKASITGNTISYTGSGGQEKYYGIQLREKSTCTSISSNKISGSFIHGIYLNGSSKATKIAKNTISSPTKDGIRVEDSSRVTSVISNKIKKPGEYGIHVQLKGSVSKIQKNTITSPGKKAGIRVASGSSTVSGNTIK